MKRIFSIALVALSLVAATSCRHDTEVYTFAADFEQPGVYQNDKNYLDGEHAILWDEGDQVAVAKISGGDDTCLATATIGGYQVTELEARFNTTGWLRNNGERYAIYPASAYLSTAKHINYPATMPYRQDDKADFTFGPNSFPMVAWKSGYGDMGFHSLSGIARVQVFTNLGTTAQINSIDFVSVPNDAITAKQISGDFEMQNINTNAPYLVSKSDADAAKKISITGISGQTVGGSKGGFALKTFYLPLPATSNGSGDNLTKYAIMMTIHATVDGEVKRFSKGFRVDIRRNAITMVPAIEITEWAIDTDNSNGAATVHLVGCGTKERPFQVYTAEELVKVREACNATNGTINGEAITADTYIKVVRADITLNAGGEFGNTGSHSQADTYGPWTEGFRSFKGHFIMASNSPVLHGIVNQSGKPLFESISEEGVVEAVTVRGSALTLTSNDAFSPICLVNNGKLLNCVNQLGVTSTGNVAGVCVTNNGTIEGCRNEAALKGANVAGICLTNNVGKTIGKCVVTAQGKLESNANGIVAGICQTNNGTVQNSYSNQNNNTLTGSYAGVCATSAGEVHGCYAAGAVKASGNVAGVVLTNSGTILGCYNSMTLLQGAGIVGGLVGQMTRGLIQDSWVDNNMGGLNLKSVGGNGDFCGGLVAKLEGGAVKNSFTRSNLIGSTGTLGAMAAQASSAASVWNVYATYGSAFCGSGSCTLEACYGRYAATGVTVITISGNKVYISNPGDLVQALNDNIPAADSDKYRTWGGTDYPVLLNNSNQ